MSFSDVRESAAGLKDKASEFGRRAAGKIDEQRQAAASRLEQAASAIHEGTGQASDIAHGAADKLSSTSEYVRDNNVSNMLKDIGKVVTRNPGPALLAAAVAGFLVGRSFRTQSD
jgi:hypothetical protein